MNTTNTHANRLRMIASGVDLQKYAVIVRQAADDIDRLHRVLRWAEAVALDKDADGLCELTVAAMNRLFEMGAWDHIDCIEDNAATLQLQRELAEAEQ